MPCVLCMPNASSQCHSLKRNERYFACRCCADIKNTLSNVSSLLALTQADMPAVCQCLLNTACNCRMWLLFLHDGLSIQSACSSNASSEAVTTHPFRASIHERCTDSTCIGLTGLPLRRQRSVTGPRLGHSTCRLLHSWPCW